MTGTMFYPNWKEKVVYPAEGAEPQVLEENEKFKMVVGGLEALRLIRLSRLTVSGKSSKAQRICLCMTE